MHRADEGKCLSLGISAPRLLKFSVGVSAELQRDKSKYFGVSAITHFNKPKYFYVSATTQRDESISVCVSAKMPANNMKPK